MEQIVTVFYQEFSGALSFLEEQGFLRRQAHRNRLYYLMYEKGDISLEVVLIAKEEQIIVINRLLMRTDEGLRGASVQSLLTQEELESPVLQELESEIDRLLRDKKFMRRLQVERDAEAARLLFEKQAQWIATALQQYMVKVEPRLRWATRLA